MGDEATGTTYGDERLPGANGPARTPGSGGTLGRIRGRLTPAPGGQPENETVYEVGSGARIQTGEQAVGKSRPRDKTSGTGERATAVEATSAAKSTLAPVRLVSRLASTALGIDADMTDQERQDIAEPLTRIYQRNGHIAAYVNRYTDPAMLLLSLGTYVLRIWLTWQQTQLARAQTQLATARQAQAQPQQPVPIRQQNTPAAPAPDRGVPAKIDGPSFTELDGIMSMGR